MTKLAEFAPPWCASCYQQNLDLRHVDFEAAYDGPVLEGATRVMIDDLILCEQCLRDGAKTLGWATDDVSADIARDKATIARLDREKDALVEYARKLEETIAKGRDSGRVAPAKGRPVKRPEVLV